MFFNTLFISIIICFSLYGGNPQYSPEDSTFTGDIENNAFAVGEKLTFGIYYQFIRVGTAIMEVKDTLDFDGHRVIHIQTRARSANFFDNFYKVRDEINTYLDIRGYYSRKFSKRLSEGSYYVNLDIVYDYEKNMLSGNMMRFADIERKKIKENSSKTFEVEINKHVYDVLASFYVTRLKPLEPGFPISMLSNDNEKLYPINVFSQKREVIETKAGRYKTVLVIPKLQGKALFEQKGKILIWLTEDRYRIPVKVESKLYFGSIYVELEKIEGHILPLPSQTN